MARWLGTAAAFLLLLPFAGCGGEDAAPALVVFGADEPLLAQTLPPQGGTLRVDRPGHPLDGLRVEVPAGAYDEPGDWEISARVVRRHALGQGVHVASPAVHIEGPTREADAPIVLTLPGAVPEGHFAMAFRYDEATGALDALPLLDQGETSVVTCTRHFSSALVASVDRTLLENGTIECGFDPRKDVWQVPNSATYLSPLGTCEGLSSTAVWYFQTRRRGGQPALAGRYDNDRMPGTPTPDLWQDDVLALELAANVQSDAYRYVEDVWPLWKRISKERASGRALHAAQIHFYAAAHSILSLDKPVLIGLRNRALEPGGHMVIGYRVTPRTLHIVDPNFPGKTDLRLRLLPPDAENPRWHFDAYRSGRTARTAKEEKRLYRHALCLGTLPLLHRDRIEQLWGDLSAQRTRGLLPELRLFAVLPGEGDGPSRRVPLEPGRTLEARHTPLEIQVEGSASRVSGLVRALADRPVPPGGHLAFEGRVRICRLSDAGTFHEERIALREGRNDLGCLVEGRLGRDHYWTGFEWVTVVFEPPDEPTAPRPVPGSVSFQDRGGKNTIRIEADRGGPLSMRVLPTEPSKPPLVEILHHLGRGYRLTGRLTIEGPSIAEWTFNLWDPTANQRHRIRDPVAYMRDGGLEVGEHYSVRIFSDDPDGGGVVLLRLARSPDTR